MADFSLNVKINGTEQAISSIGEIEAALRATKEELKGVEIGSVAFEELSAQARVLQDELKASFKEATNFDKNLGLLTESVSRLGSTVAASFSLALSAVQLFGGESEELTQAQVKAQQALAIAFAATTIATNSAKIAGDAKLVVDRLQVGVTQLLTAALGRETIAKAAAAVATGTATVAQRALNAAMAANPIGLVVAALTTLIGALFIFNQSTDEATESTDDLTAAKERFNDELDRSTKAIQNEIARQKELIKLQGQVREAEATTNEERLRIRQQTNIALGQLDLESLNEEKKNLDTKLKNERAQLDQSTIFVRQTLEAQKKLQDANLESVLSDQDKELANLIRTQQNGAISTENYYKELIKIRLKYATEDEEKKRLEDLIKTYPELQQQVTDVNAEIAAQNARRLEEERLAQIELEKVQRENLQKRLEQLNEFNKDVDGLNKKRLEESKKIERELSDFQLDRISEVTESFEFQGQTFTVTNEDIIKGYDERIAIIRETFVRQRDDARQAFEEELRLFEANEKKRLDANGRRVISDKQIQDAISKQRADFEANELAREENFTLKLEAVEQDRANKIKEIDDILRRELAFGANDLADNRTKIALEAVDFEIQQSQRRIELLRGFDIELVRSRQEAERKKLDILRQSQIEELQITTLEALKSVQGTEEQKGKQRESITQLYNERLARINADFRSQEELLDRKAADETLAYKIQAVQTYAQILIQSFNTILDLFRAVSELAQVERENELNALKESTTQQINTLNEQYTAQVEAQQAALQSGLINQEQYNQAINQLDTNRTNATSALEKKLRDEEFKAKKKAFEDEKKLRIAQTIIAGIQGALTAFTSAFQLGPIAGPIVGGLLAAIVAATTGVQVAAIAKQKFDGGEQSITPPSAAGGGGAPGADVIAQASAGGFTQFDQTLTGAPSGQTPGTPGTDNVIKVVVLESDITGTQTRVKTAEGNATIG